MMEGEPNITTTLERHPGMRRKRRRSDEGRRVSVAPHSAVVSAIGASSGALFYRNPPPIPRSSRSPSHRIPLPTLICLLALVLISLPTAQAAASCLRFADYDSINSLFTSGGPGTVIQLCPSKVYRLSGPIIFTAADQELTTFGRPTDDTRAVLRVQGNGETAVQGDCRRCKGVKIRNLVIDGYRPKLGRSKPTEAAGALIVLGGNEGQVVQDCVIREPRGFTAIHIREGDKLECKGARIVGNAIGPIGEEYDSKKDGVDPELSPLGKPLADGVSLACRDSVVRDNVFVDNTAAAIVLYCSPGTVVENNTITSEKRSAMAGILMVDATPFNADYTGVIVRENTVSARGAGMRVGIGIGPTVWSDDTETILKGGSVTLNRLEGAHMGYGIAAAGLSGWTIMDNVDKAKYEGRRGERCFPEAVNPDPMPFVYTSNTVKDSEIQEDFVDAEFQYAACLDPILPNTPQNRRKARKAANDAKKLPNAKTPPIPEPVAPPGKGKPQKPVAAPKVQPPPRSPADDEDPEEDGKAALESFDTGSEMMDALLEHSRFRVIEEIEKLNQRVDGLFMNEGKEQGTPKKADKVTGKKAANLGGVVGLQKRVEALEKDQGKLVEEATGLRSGMQQWNQEMTKVHAWEHELLLDIQSRLHHHFLTHPSDHIEVSPGEHHDDHSGHEANQAILSVSHDQAGKESIERWNLRQRSERARLLASANGETTWTSWAIVLAIVGVAVWGWRVWRGRGGKGSSGPGTGAGMGGGGLATGASMVSLGSGSGSSSGQIMSGKLAGAQGQSWRPWMWRGGHRKEH